MAEAVVLERIFEELKDLKEDVTFIKKHMFDPDTVLTSEEARIFDQSMQELKEGKTVPLSAVKKHLGL